MLQSALLMNLESRAINFEDIGRFKQLKTYYCLYYFLYVFSGRFWGIINVLQLKSSVIRLVGGV